MYSLCKRIFKPIEITVRRDLGRKNFKRGDESIQVIVHICMEISQGNSLCSYLKK
jgi:hypothetical protein